MQIQFGSDDGGGALTAATQGTSRVSVESELLAPNEVAQKFKVDGSTVRRWMSARHFAG